MDNLSGKSVVVTGGGSGMGRTAAELLGKAGCLVTVADRDEAAGRQVAAAIAAGGKGKSQFVLTDVSDEGSIKAMVEAAELKFGRLDGAINSAGIAQRGKKLADLPAEEWDRCIGINLRGMFLCMKYQIQAMQRAGGGSIVAVASTSAIKAFPNAAEYCASKAVVTGLVRAAAIDYITQNIRVNAILPGGTLTPMMENAIKANPQLAKAIDVFPMKRWAQPEEVAGAMVWLISDAASYVTGSSWTVDGGLSIC
jgi:2,5-dichloro-2,5-cyclohexadiene-1,4-diol dehydrogenase 1